MHLNIQEAKIDSRKHIARKCIVPLHDENHVRQHFTLQAIPLESVSLLTQ